MTTDQLIVVLNLAALVSIMFSMGLQVRFLEIWDSIRQGRMAVQCVIANYVLVPAVALGLLFIFNANHHVAIGFFILAVCPAAPVGPPLTALASGNLSLSIGMMVLLAGLSTVLSPLILSLYLSIHAPGGNLSIDYLAIIRTLLIAQLLPMISGLLIHHWKPLLTHRIRRPIATLGNALMVALIATIICNQYRTLAEITFRGWFGMTLLLTASLLIGWVLGGRKDTDRKAIAMTTGPRNAAVGLAIATSNFVGTPVVTAVVAYGLASMIGTLTCAFLLHCVATFNVSSVDQKN